MYLYSFPLAYFCRYPGGVGGRVLKYKLLCNRSLDKSVGPSFVDTAAYTYTVIWQTPVVCNPEVLPASACPAPPPIPTPTPDQLLFQEMELGALICYNMATTTGTQGCPSHSVPPASRFNDVAPATVNTDQWCARVSVGRYQWY